MGKRGWGWGWSWAMAMLVSSACGSGEAVVHDEFEQEPDTGYFVADHDLPAQTAAEARLLNEGDDQRTAEQGLTVAQVAGRDDVWPKTVRHQLTYCIDVSGFGAHAPTVKRALEAAAADWQSAADVTFEHVASEDDRCSRKNTQVVFDVRPVKHRAYLARSFFPSQGRGMRELLIDSSALPPTKPWSLTGVLRHELGHVLGLRHEHTRFEDNPCFEDDHWRALTTYDSKSVMHYPQCAGANTGDLVLTERDRRGVASLYH